MPDSNGYPTEVELSALKAFRGSPSDLVAVVSELWWHDAFTVEQDERHGETIVALTLSTWGWSGNEEIISVLERSWFWFFFWAVHIRGGHYKFEVPLWQWKTPLPEPFMVVEA